MKRGFLTLAAIAAIFSASFAATPRTDAKDASATEVKASVKSETHQFANTYYVTGIVGDQYTLSETPPPPNTCQVNGTYPCQISSDSELSSPIDMEEVDSNPEEVSIDGRRNTL